MSLSARSRYTGYRFPPEIINHSVWLYFRFPLSLRMVEEMLAARGAAAQSWSIPLEGRHKAAKTEMAADRREVEKAAEAIGGCEASVSG